MIFSATPTNSDVWILVVICILLISLTFLSLAAKTSVSPSISDAAARNESSFRDDSITFAPASANDFAIDLPIPREAPVTKATLPFKEISIFRP